MKLWIWFCQLGTEEGNQPLPFFPVNQSTHVLPPATGISTTETACTRLCGQNGCRCGGTIRGLHCVWSHYRMQ